MGTFDERSTRVYRQKQMFSKEELAARESLCVHEQSPFCNAACPLKMDARGLADALRKGDFTAARAAFSKIAPFPHILAQGCEAPCSTACRLSEAGEGLHMPALERAALAYGEAGKKGRGSLFKIKKKKRAALFGGELFTLALAGELAEKSYPLHFYIEDESAEALVARCAPFLSPDARREEAARLSAMDIELRFGSALDAAFWEAHRGEYDIVGLSGALLALLGCGAPDALTLCTEEGWIAPTETEGAGVLAAFYGARRAALSADRLAQSLSPHNMRGEEGPTASALYTDLEGLAPGRRVEEKDGLYLREEAMAEAKRCIDCRCDACIRGCAYLRHYKTYPRLLTREIYNNVSIIMGDHMMNKPINSCALCGQCSVLCPNGYDMAEVCRAARENMVQTDKMPLAAHEFALYDMLFSNGEAFLARPQPGFTSCRYVFFPGCQAAAIAPETVKAAYLDLMERLPGGVGLMLGCCGAIADWAGRESLLEDCAALLRGALARLGNPTVIAGCPSCKKTLAKLTDSPVRGVWDVLEEIGLPEGARAGGLFAIHDACGARGDADTQRAVRNIAEKLGLALEETEYGAERTQCCGYGGLVMYANPPVAKEMAQSCAAESRAPFLHYCMACRDRLAREGRKSLHLLELVYGAAASETPDISEKRKNRLALRRGLLKELWQEEIMEEKTAFPLRFTQEARTQMDARMILEGDVAAVMRDYHEKGEAIFDEEAGLLVARKRIGNVTFWVRFVKEDGGYEVRGAYSHRMLVK